MLDTVTPCATGTRETAAALPVRPRWRGRLHQLAFVASVPAGVALVRGAAPERRSALAVYALSVAALFATSAAYHRGTWSPHARRRMKRLDHAMIFAFIGGTYTAFGALLLQPPLRATVLVAAWLGAVAAALFKTARIDEANALADASYMVVGWVPGLLVFPRVAPMLDAVQTALLIGAGVVYSAGAAILARNRPDPWPATFGYHELGHAVMLLGTAGHYLLYLQLAR
jgi:hemolysin III